MRIDFAPAGPRHDNLASISSIFLDFRLDIGFSEDVSIQYGKNFPASSQTRIVHVATDVRIENMTTAATSHNPPSVVIESPSMDYQLSGHRMAALRAGDRDVLQVSSSPQ